MLRNIIKHNQKIRIKKYLKYLKKNIFFLRYLNPNQKKFPNLNCKTLKYRF